MAFKPIRLFTACCAAALLLVRAAWAQPVPEYDLKAAFVYNFALFTEWPEGMVTPESVLNICISPTSNVRAALVNLSDKAVKGRRFVVRYGTTPEALRNCHVLFVDSSDRDRWGQIKKALLDSSVLTVTDDDDIGRDGSMISLSMQQNRVVFDIDLRAAKQAKLVLSSKLLRLARNVQ